MRKAQLKNHVLALRAKQAALLGAVRLNRVLDMDLETGGDELDEVRRDIERSLMVRGIDRNTALLREVRAALHRIEDDTYGICLRCDGPISQKRLEAVPWTAYCVVCQSAADQNTASEVSDERFIFRH